jgi:hypothetical protein
MWFHQHFNGGTTPARYLAFKHEVVTIRNAQACQGLDQRRVGGDQISYADEIRSCGSVCRRTGEDQLTPRMDQAYAQGCGLPPPIRSRRNVAPIEDCHVRVSGHPAMIKRSCP